MRKSDNLGERAGGSEQGVRSAAQMPAVQYTPKHRQKRSLFGRLADWVFQEEEDAYVQPPAMQAVAGRGRQGGGPEGSFRDPYEERQLKTELAQKALRDWKAATVYFENVDDPALVDYAAYDMEAAKRKYMYLLNSVKNSGRSYY